MRGGGGKSKARDLSSPLFSLSLSSSLTVSLGGEADREKFPLSLSLLSLLSAGFLFATVTHLSIQSS